MKTMDPQQAMNMLQTVATAVAKESQPEKIFSIIDQCLNKMIGHRLFTILILDLDSDSCQRCYSSQPDLYPIGGKKKINRSDDFFHELVIKKKPRLCYNYEDIKVAFYDHELIYSLGCESAINYPIQVEGKIIGSLNILHKSEWYSADDFNILKLYSIFLIPSLLKLIKVNLMA